jgi:hypothetical protein
MTPRQEIIDRFNRLHVIGSTEADKFARATITKATIGHWILRRETRSQEVLIAAYNKTTGAQPLYGRWRPDRSMYDYRFDTYNAEACENDLLPALRAALVLDDLSRL